MILAGLAHWWANMQDEMKKYNYSNTSQNVAAFILFITVAFYIFNFRAFLKCLRKIRKGQKKLIEIALYVLLGPLYMWVGTTC